ncbi:hypothetical protein D9M71_377410 [compost metagenome]
MPGLQLQVVNLVAFEGESGGGLWNQSVVPDTKHRCVDLLLAILHDRFRPTHLHGRTALGELVCRHAIFVDRQVTRADLARRSVQLEPEEGEGIHANT